MARLRSNPQGSVLGALNALFSPHPVTGAPSASQAAQQGLLGKIISQPGGGGTTGPQQGGQNVLSQVLGDTTGSAQGNANQRVSTVGLPQNTTTTDKVNVVGAPTDNNITTTDRVNTVGLPTDNSINTTDTVTQRVIPARDPATGRFVGADTTSTDTVKEKLDESGIKDDAAKAGKDAADATDDALTKESKSKGSGWFSGFLSGIPDMITKALSGGGSGNGNSGGKNSSGKSGDSSSALDSGLIGGIGPGIAGVSTKAAAITGAVGTALAALPALAGVAGTGLGVALIGGAVAAVAAESPKLKAQFTAIGGDIKTVFTAAGAPIIPALSAVLNQVPALVKQLQAPLAGIFKTVAPQIQGVFSGLIPILNGLIGVMAAAAPAFGPFIESLESLAGNIFPGIETVVKATVPLISQFGTILGQLGSNLGGLFSSAAPAIQASMQVLGDLLSVVGGLLPILTQLGSIFATALAPVFTQFGSVVKSLEPVLVLVGQVLASLAKAVVGDLVSAFGAVATAVKAATPGLSALASGLGQVFTVMENAGVFAILGDALENLAGPIGSLVSTLASGLVPILTQVVNFVGQLSAVIVSQLTSALIQLLPSVTQLANVALAALAAVLPVILPLLVQVAGVLTAGLAGAITGIASALTAVVSAIPPSVLGAIAVGITAVVGALKLWGAATAAVSSGIESTMAGAVGGMIGSLKEFQLATEGVTVAEKAQLAGLLALDAAGPGILVGLTAGVVALGAALVLTNAQAQTVVGQFASQNQQIGYNISGYQKLADTITTASQGYAKFAQSSTDAVRGGAAGAQQLSQQLSTQASQVSAEAVNMQTRLTALSQGLGVSQTTIEQWASAAGISATKFAGAGESVGSLTTQIVSYVDKNAQAVTATASLGTNMAIFGNSVFNATAQLDAFNGIWNTLVGGLLTKQTAITQSASQFDSLKQTIADSGANSDAASQSFQSYISQIGASASALEKGGASVSQINGYLQTQIDNIESLGPLNKGQEADLQALKSFQDALANSTHGLTDQQTTWISQLEASLIPDLEKMGADTPAVKTDIDNLANSIAQTGANSASTASDRAQLIKDLEAAGVSAQDATKFVDGLSTSLKQVPTSVGVTVNLSASGGVSAAVTAPGVASVQGGGQLVLSTAGAAGGMRITAGSGPKADDVLIRVSKGETVVSAADSALLAPVFSALQVPGYATGGVPLSGVAQAVTYAGQRGGAFAASTGTAFLSSIVAAYQGDAIQAYADGGLVTGPGSGYWASSGSGYTLGGSSGTSAQDGSRAGGASMDDLAARLDQLHADMQQMVSATRAVPAGVGAHVGGAINGAAHDASFRSRYPRGGA